MQVNDIMEKLINGVSTELKYAPSKVFIDEETVKKLEEKFAFKEENNLVSDYKVANIIAHSSTKKQLKYLKCADCFDTNLVLNKEIKRKNVSYNY